MSQDLKPYLQMFMETARPITIDEVAKLYNKNREFVRQKAIQLLNLGYLTRKGIGKMLPYYYEVKVNANTK
jgi:predicted transcriptional regulator